MYCYPFETKKTYNETINLLKECKPSLVNVSFLRPDPDTKLYNFHKEHNIKEPSMYEVFMWLTLKWKIYLSYKSLKEVIILLFKSFDLSVLFFRITVYIRYLLNKNSNKNKINLAKDFFDKQNYKEAIKWFNKIKIKKDNYWIYGDRALAKMNIGDYKGAIKDFNKAIKFEPKDFYKQKRQECLILLK